MHSPSPNQPAPDTAFTTHTYHHISHSPRFWCEINSKYSTRNSILLNCNLQRCDFPLIDRLVTCTGEGHHQSTRWLSTLGTYLPNLVASTIRTPAHARTHIPTRTQLQHVPAVDRPRSRRLARLPVYPASASRHHHHHLLWPSLRPRHSAIVSAHGASEGKRKPQHHPDRPSLDHDTSRSNCDLDCLLQLTADKLTANDEIPNVGSPVPTLHCCCALVVS